jgi:pilus assembly protein Flp/PilA
MFTYARAFISANVRKVIKSEEGASLVEYGLLVALIAVVCIAAITSLGSAISDLFKGVKTAITKV